MGVQSKLSQVFNYQSWIHAVSGAAGGCIAMTTFYPLDTVRSRLQLEDPAHSGEARSTMNVMKEIVLGEGLPALYSGLGPVLQSLCISNFVYFYTFHSLKAIAAANMSSGKAQQSAVKDLLLGSVAGVVNVFATTPFWVVNTRLRMRNVTNTGSGTADFDKHYDNLIAGLRYVARTEGVRGLWSGTLPSLMLVSNPALQFMMYELLKRHVLRLTGATEMSSAGYFFIGAIAKGFATVLTYPLQLVQMKLRHCSNNSHTTSNRASTSVSQRPPGNIGVLTMMLSIWRQQGVRGLFRGLEAKILQTVLTAALMFMAYEKIASAVGLLLRKSPAAATALVK